MPLNKRKHIRTPILLGALPPAKMTFFKPFYHGPFEVEIQDLSAGGMKVYSSEPFPLYFEFALEFQLPGTEVIQARAKAVHQVHNERGYEVGVFYTEIGDEVKSVIEAMAKDFDQCEIRIKNEESDVCRQTCRFITLCQKPQKILIQ